MLPSVNKARRAAVAAIMDVVDREVSDPQARMAIRAVVRHELDRLSSQVMGIINAHTIDLGVEEDEEEMEGREE